MCSLHMLEGRGSTHLEEEEVVATRVVEEAPVATREEEVLPTRLPLVFLTVCQVS